MHPPGIESTSGVVIILPGGGSANDGKEMTSPRDVNRFEFPQEICAV